MTIVIALKGGQTITVNCDQLEVYCDGTGKIRTMNWYNPDVVIRHLDNNDISAIVELKGGENAIRN